MNELTSTAWPQTTIKQSSYLKGRIGWQGLRASEFTNDGPYLITGTDFKNGGIDWDSCYRVSEERFREAYYIHIRDGDLLVTKDGTIGKIALIRACPLKAVLNSGIFLLRCSDGSYDHAFLYHMLTSEHFEKFLRTNLNGSTINHLYQYVFETFAFPVPPIEYQRRVATILANLDGAIEQTEALIAKYQQIKAGLMHDLFTRGVTPNGRLRSTYATAQHLYRESPLGWIPKEWEVAPAERLCQLITKGITPVETLLTENSSAIPFLRVQNLSFDGRLEFDEDRTYVSPAVARGELARSRVFPGDVLMNIVGPPLGKVSVVPDAFSECNMNQAIAVFRPMSVEFRPYLRWYLLSSVATQWFVRRAKRTSGQVNLTLEMCSNLPVSYPRDRGEMREITDRLDAIQGRIESEENHRRKLGILKSGLMHDLLTGRVRVDVEKPGAT